MIMGILKILSSFCNFKRVSKWKGVIKILKNTALLDYLLRVTLKGLTIRPSGSVVLYRLTNLQGIWLPKLEIRYISAPIFTLFT